MNSRNWSKLYERFECRFSAADLELFTFHLCVMLCARKKIDKTATRSLHEVYGKGQGDEEGQGRENCLQSHND